MKDRNGDYRDWRYLCEVVRVADGSEVLAPPRTTVSEWQSLTPGAHLARHVTVCRWHACSGASHHHTCRQRFLFCSLLGW